MITIFTILLFVMLAIAIIFGILINNHNVYCYVFEHKQWKLWQGFIKNASQFQYVGRFDNCGDEYAWYDLFGNIRYRAIVWDKPIGTDEKNNPLGVCTIHQGTDCVLCNFSTKNSNKMADLLDANKPMA